jgi:hypothetical protein
VIRKEAVALPMASRIKMLMRWSTEKKDIDGKWSWGQRDWTKAVWKGTIQPFLYVYETKRWFEIEQEKT